MTRLQSLYEKEMEQWECELRNQGIAIFKNKLWSQNFNLQTSIQPTFSHQPKQNNCDCDGWCGVGDKYKSYQLMQAIRQRYNSWAVCFYNSFHKYYTNCPATPYFVYAYRMAATQFPKIAYQTPFEPAYTRPEVKYNAPVVVSMILFTLWYSRKVVGEEEEANVHKEWYIHAPLIWPPNINFLIII